MSGGVRSTLLGEPVGSFGQSNLDHLLSLFEL